MIARVIASCPVSATAPDACFPLFCRDLAMKVTADATLRQPVAGFSSSVCRLRHTVTVCALARGQISGYLRLETSARRGAAI
jgi:hypothetical protein